MKSLGVFAKSESIDVKAMFLKDLIRKTWRDYLPSL